MEQEIELEPSEDLAYWVGAVQTDGCLFEYRPKEKNKSEMEISFGVAKKSVPMVERVRDISLYVLKRKGRIYKEKKGDRWHYHIKVKQLLDSFKKLDIRFGDPPIPPEWTLKKIEFFGAYLAGVIDGDGDIGIRRPKYPQCAIRITSGSKQFILAEDIKKILKCSYCIAYYKTESYLKGKKIVGSCYRMEFYVSSKTSKFILDFVIPHLKLVHKKEKLQEFISKKYPLLIEN